MPALRKPHRIAVLLPDVTIEGSDVQLEHEAALVLWIACIETCQRHPALAVYDAESTFSDPTCQAPVRIAVAPAVTCTASRFATAAGPDGQPTIHPIAPRDVVYRISTAEQCLPLTVTPGTVLYALGDALPAASFARVTDRPR